MVNDKRKEVCIMILSMEQVKDLYLPVFTKYNIDNVWVFGSTARGTNHELSDIDFLYDRPSQFKTDPFLALDLFDELSTVTDKEIDLVTTDDLKRVGGTLYEAVVNERKSLRV